MRWSQMDNVVFYQLIGKELNTFWSFLKYFLISNMYASIYLIQYQ